jgi:hypothetical protein
VPVPPSGPRQEDLAKFYANSEEKKKSDELYRSHTGSKMRLKTEKEPIRDFLTDSYS